MDEQYVTVRLADTENQLKSGKSLLAEAILDKEKIGGSITVIEDA